MNRGAVSASLVAFALLAPAGARAQATGDTARAEALFNAGKQLRDAGQWPDACTNFAESKRLAPGVGISLYLADCYEHTGHTSSAYHEFREAERLARERDDKRAETAHTRALALESKLGGLLIAVPSAAGHEAPEILLDGTRVPPEQWNVAMTVDPGDHVITVNASGQAPRTLNARVDAGYRPTTVQVEDAAGSAPTPAAATAPAEGSPASSGGGSTRTWTGVTLTVLGAAGIGIGTVLALTAPAQPPSCTPPPQDNRTTVEAVAYAAGAAALLGGLVVLTVVPHKAATGLTVTPMTVAGGGGAMLRTIF